jgi:hypothetical protein
MKTTDETQQNILEEEAYRKQLRDEEADREQLIANKTDKKKGKWYKSNAFIILLLIFVNPIGILFMWLFSNWKTSIKWIITIIVSICFLYSLYHPFTGSSGSTNAPTPTPAISQAEKDNLAKTFCDERSQPAVSSVNLNDFIAMSNANGENVTLHPANGIYPTEGNCKKIIDICLDHWTKEDCQNIAARKIWIGMNENELILSWGLPSDRNDTVMNTGINTQWVYGDFGPYVYLEGSSQSDLKVTSWQKNN